jgi:hypothetical protein
VKQRGITQSASETTEDCKRQAVRTVASQKNKGVTPTQSKESLDINPESEKPPIPEPEGEVSRALNQEKIKIQLPGNQLPVKKMEENEYETGAGHTWAAYKNYRKDAKKDGMEKSDNRPGAMLDKILARAR